MPRINRKAARRGRLEVSIGKERQLSYACLLSFQYDLIAFLLCYTGKRYMPEVQYSLE